MKEPTRDPEIEVLVDQIIDVLSFRFRPDASPVGVLYYFDKHEFTAAQWRRIEEVLTGLVWRVMEQRRSAEEYERKQ